MPVNIAAYNKLIEYLKPYKGTLVAVSKTKPAENILELYHLGHRDFGENYVQELAEKYEKLPKDIHWHFIGHLQTNKVKYIAPYVSLIHGVDSEKLLKEINKQAAKNNRVIDCLLQVHIAQEETKFGFNEEELNHFLKSDFGKYKNVQIRGLMGMASLSNDENKVRGEFEGLKKLFNQAFSINIRKTTNDESSSYPFHREAGILSMGMSADYKIALDEGSNMVRIGSLLFGERIKE